MREREELDGSTSGMTVASLRLPLRGILAKTALCSSALLLASPAQAGEPDQKAHAVELFKQGLALRDQNRTAEACEKFNKAYRLYPSGVGPMMNTAWCHAQAGRVASAWSLYQKTEEAAKAAGRQDDATAAAREADLLQRRLPFVVVRVPSSPPAWLEVQIDDSVVPAEKWNQPVPVDPGPHTVRATAPGKKAWTRKIEAAERSRANVEVPLLQDDEAPPAEPAPTPAQKPTKPEPSPKEEPSWWTDQHTSSMAVGAIAVTALAVGGAYAWNAKKTYDKSEPYCSNNVCSPFGGEYRDDAWSKARVATVATGIGAAAAVGAVLLWVTAPSSDAPARGTTVVPAVGTSGCLIEARVVF